MLILKHFVEVLPCVDKDVRINLDDGRAVTAVQQMLCNIFNEWKELTAWKEFSFRRTRATFQRKKSLTYPTVSIGRAWSSHRYRIKVKFGTDVLDAIVTLLHEMSHIVTLDDGFHPESWRTVFSDACDEVFGKVPDLADSSFELHRNIYNCLVLSLDEQDIFKKYELNHPSGMDYPELEEAIIEFKDKAKNDATSQTTVGVLDNGIVNENTTSESNSPANDSTNDSDSMAGDGRRYLGWGVFST